MLQVKRLTIADQSLHDIRASMPTASDSWEVEAVAEYRFINGLEQWLVKWKDYGEDHNTWEPWENLLSDAAQVDARKVQDATLPSMASKLTVKTLRAILEARKLETTGLKPDLVARLIRSLA